MDISGDVKKAGGNDKDGLESENKTCPTEKETNGNTPNPELKISPSKKECDTVTDALNYLVQGKRHLLVKDIKSAVNSFQDACKLMSEQFGELSNECAEAYFCYGKSLLELARLESGVLGPGFDKDESEESDEEADDEDEQNEDPVENDVNNDENEEIKDDIPDVSEEKDEDLTAEANKAGEKQNSAEENEEDEISSLQLAWEVLEMAKIIFQKQSDNSKDVSLKLSQTYLKLGEVSMESENHDQAVEDVLECVKLQEKYLHSHDRLLAETYFQLGSAYCLQNNFSSSLETLQKVIQTIRDRMKCLQNRADSLKNEPKKMDIMGCIHDDEVKQVDPFYTLEGEIQELEQIIPGIESKIADVLEVKRQAELNVMKELQESIMGLGSSPVKQNTTPDPQVGSSTSSVQSFSQPVIENKPASDISHLVKKRKTDPVSEGVSKRLCVETPVSNSH